MAGLFKPWRCDIAVFVVVIFIVGVMVKLSSADDDDDDPFMSQFPEGVDQMTSNPREGSRFQYLRVHWLRQTRHEYGRKVDVKLKILDGSDTPEIEWMVNDEIIAADDRDYPQSLRVGPVASITIYDDVSVTSLTLLVTMDTIHTTTRINLQELSLGNTILEHGTDVALALSSQEDVSFQNDDQDLVFLARFFAEDLIEGNYTGLDVYLLPENDSPHPADQEVFSPDQNPDVLTLWSPAMEEVPSVLHERFDSPLSSHAMLRIHGDQVETDGGIVIFTAQYDNKAPCRLFGGQTISRRVFLHTTSS